METFDGFFIFANSTDYDTGASDADFTVVDGGTLPFEMTSDYVYFVHTIAITPLTVSDTFNYRIVTLDSDKATKAVKSMIMSVVTAAARSATDMQFLELPPFMELHYGSNACYVGVEVDFGDTDAKANIGIAVHRMSKKFY